MATAESGKQSGTDGAQASETTPVGTDKSLDSLIAEWGESSSATPDNAGDVVGRVLKKVEPALNFVAAQAAKTESEDLTKDLNAALDFMLEPDEYKDFPKRWMRSFLEGYSTESDSFSNAFENRHANPDTWRSELAKAREAFPEWAKELPGSKVRSDVEAAKAAVSGTSNERADPAEKSEQEQAVELMQMSEGEYRRHVELEIAKAEANAR